MRRVVVTGMGALSPIGNNVKDFSESLFKGVNGCDYITRFDATHFPTRFACELKGFNVADFIPHKDARRLDPFTQYALVVAEQAIADAGIDPAQIDSELAGVIW